MVYTQPVLYEFPDIATPTLLVIGQQDRTTLGRRDLPPNVLKTMGQYPQLGKRAAAFLQHAKLVEPKNVGHTPHLEAKCRFNGELLKSLHACALTGLASASVQSP